MENQFTFEAEPFELNTETDESEASAFELEWAGESFEAGGGVAARSASPPVSQKLQQLRLAHANLHRTIQTLGRHVKQQNGVLRVALPVRSVEEAAAKLGLSPQSVRHVMESLKRTNARRAQARQAGAMETEIEGESGSCPGVTNVETSWWGIQIRLNECHTQSLLNTMSVGAGAGSLCSAIAPAAQVKIVCGVLAALGGIGGAAIAEIDRWGGNRGIVISKTWAPVPPVVWHQ